MFTVLLYRVHTSISVFAVGTGNRNASFLSIHRPCAWLGKPQNALLLLEQRVFLVLISYLSPTTIRKPCSTTWSSLSNEGWHNFGVACPPCTQMACPNLTLTQIHLRRRRYWPLTCAYHFVLVFFLRSISVICPMVVLKLAATVFTGLYFRTSWPNWHIIFFGYFKKPRLRWQQKFSWRRQLGPYRCEKRVQGGPQPLGAPHTRAIPARNNPCVRLHQIGYLQIVSSANLLFYKCMESFFRPICVLPRGPFFFITHTFSKANTCNLLDFVYDVF